ncbi:MAG TPA: hypothetical protein VG734_11200 [Lacunisphaera sp.]|nr:hypothetical protein [Lacunisphaera sp.]
MAKPPDSEHQDVLPGNEELQKLNRNAVVVYAARNALRALVLVRFSKDSDPIHLEAAFRAVQAAIVAGIAQDAAEARRHAAAAAAAAETIMAQQHAEIIDAAAASARAAAADAAASATPFDAGYAIAAAAARVTDATVNAIAAAAYAARAAGDRTVDTGAAVTAAAYAARATIDVAARATSRAAARADYQNLTSFRAVDLTAGFFRLPLWPGRAPDWWEEARRNWHEGVKGCGLEVLGQQYEAWLRGEIDPVRMLREVEDWCAWYERQKKNGGAAPRGGLGNREN